MKTVKDYRDAFASTQEEIVAIADVAKSENRAFTKAEKTKLEALEKRLGEIEEDLALQEKVEARIAQKIGDRVAAREGSPNGNRAPGEYRSIFTPSAAPSKEAKFPNPLGMLARSAYDPKYAEKRGITSSSGAATIQNPWVTNEAIYQLSSGFVIGQTGIPIIGPDNYTQWPVITTGPLPVWFAEGDTISPDTTMAIGSKKIEYKYISVRVKCSHFWFRDSALDGEALINEAILRAIDEALMTAVLSGDSGSKQPDGFDNIASVQTVDAENVPLTDYTKRVEAVRKIMSAKARLENISHVYGTFSWAMAQNMVGDDGQPLMMPKGLEGVRSVHSSAVLENYGDDNDLTREYFFDRTNIRIAIGPEWRITLHETYAATMELAFQVVVPIDLQIFHPTTACIIENISTSALIL